MKRWMALWGVGVMWLSGHASAQDAPGSERTCAPGSYAGTVECVNAEAAYRLRTARHDPAPFTAAVEMTVFLAGGTAWYWIDKDKNVADWDFDSWGDRFDRDAFRMDNNQFGVNFVLHPMSGSAFYGFARSNDLSVGVSFTYAFVTSFVWEWLLEFRERVSVNDQIATPAAGLVVGEFFHKLGRFLHDTPAPSRGRRALAWLFGTPQALSRAIRRRRGVDAGIDGRWNHAFRLGYGATLATDPSRRFHLHTIDFDGTLIDLPGHLREGRYRRFFHDANVSRLRARATRGRAGGGFDLAADNVLFGVEAQSIQDGRGSAVIAGLGMGYRYRRQTYRRRADDATSGWHDRLGIVQLPGLSLEGTLVSPRVQLHTMARMHPDFAGVHTEPFAEWQAAHPAENTKSILEKQNYTYGWGMSAELSAELTFFWPRVRIDLGGRTWFGRWESREGRDRTQADLTVDIESRDQSLDLEGWFRVHTPRSLYVEVGVRSQRRHTLLEDLRHRSGLRQLTLSLGLSR